MAKFSLFFTSIVGISLIIAGCLHITAIDMPQEVSSGEEMSIEVTCSPEPGSEEYVGSLYWAFLGVYVPDDWVLTEARVDSPIKVNLKENSRVATLMDLYTLTQSGFKWMGLLTEKQVEYSEKMISDSIVIKLKFIAGKKTGLFPINFHIGVSDSNQVTLDGINWGNDLGVMAIEVVQ